ncbi:MAG: hypothetical protein OHK0029_30240 [Armatimonadaceae bacterium]
MFLDRPQLKIDSCTGDQIEQRIHDLSRSASQVVLRDAQQAMVFVQQLVEITENTGSRAAAAHANYLRGWIARNEARHTDALRLLFLAREDAEAVGDIALLSRILNITNLVYLNIGEFARALECCFAARTYALENDDPEMIARTTHNIGLLYKNQQDYPSALAELEQALVIKRAVGNKVDVAYTLGLMGDVYNDMGDDDRAMQCLRQSLRMSHAGGDRRCFSHGLLSLGCLYNKMKRWTTAVRYLRAVLPISEGFGDRLQQSCALTSLSEALYGLERFEDARIAAESGYRISVEIDAPEVQREALKFLSLIHEAQGDFRQALAFSRQAQEADAVYQERQRQRLFSEFRLRQETDAARQEAEAEKQKNMLLQRLAHTDTLTGLANRRAMNEQIAQAIRAAESDGVGFCLCLGDVDHFKRVNDECGHEAGDQILTHIASRLRDAMGDSGMAARWGGEEFCLIFRGVPCPSVISRLRMFLVNLSADPVLCREFSLRISMTFGVTTFLPGDTHDELLRRADTALYAGKRSGRACVMVAMEHGVAPGDF